MQFKKLAAVAGSALMAGLALAGPVLATQVSQLGQISNMVSVSGTTASFPIFVIGASAQTADVAGAIDIATNLASNAVVTSSVTSTIAGESVTGGAKVATSGIYLTPYYNPQNVKGILTASDIPSLLGTGTYSASSGGSYQYKQYLYILGQDTNSNPAEIVFARPTTENSPRITFKTPGSSTLWTYKLTFSTPVSLSGMTSTATLETILQGTTINLLGKDFIISDCTIGGGTSAGSYYISDMTLLGGNNVITVETGTPQTVTTNSKDYTVTLTGVAAQTIGTSTYYSAIGDVNGESFTLKAGDTKVLSDGTTIAAIKVFQGKTGAADYASLAIGANKIKLSAGSRTGTDTSATGSVSQGTTVVPQLTSDIVSSDTVGLSTIIIKYQPSQDAWLSSGGTVADPFASTFSMKFNSIVPDITDTVNRQTISFNPSGYNMLMTYMNAAGAQNQMYTLYTTDGSAWKWASSTVSATNQDNGYRDVVFDEGSNISAIEQDYFIINKGGFSHTMQFTSFTPSTSTLTFTDESGNSITATNTTATAADLIVDGNDYKVYIVDATKKIINVDLNGNGNIAGTAAGSYSYGSNTGKEYSFLTPKLITTGQGGLYFYNGMSSAKTPAAAGAVASVGLFGFNLTNSSASAGNLRVGSTSIGTIASGTVNNVTGTSDDGYIDMVVNCTAGFSCNVGIGTSATGILTDPGFVLVEEAQQGGTTHNWIFLPVKWDSTNTRTYIGSTVYTDDSNVAAGTSWDVPVLGTATEYKGLTTYGTLVDHLSSTLGGSATLNYPDVFTYGNLYVLTPTGTTSSGGTGGTMTTQQVLPITADVVKLDTDSDINTAIQNNDVIMVGGPCINRIAAQALGLTFPACGAASGIPQNAALIELFTDKFATGKTALLVAGWEAADTDLAARIVQTGFPGATATQLAKSTLTVTGTVASPSYS